MINSVQAAAARIHWLALLRLYGEDVTYIRGDLQIKLKAVPAKPKAAQVSAGQSVVINSQQMDWLIIPADLVDGQIELEPRRGDKVARPNGQVFRVSPADGSEDVWRWSDGACTWRRVQTEEV